MRFYHSAQVENLRSHNRLLTEENLQLRGLNEKLVNRAEKFETEFELQGIVNPFLTPSKTLLFPKDISKEKEGRKGSHDPTDIQNQETTLELEEDEEK